MYVLCLQEVEADFERRLNILNTFQAVQVLQLLDCVLECGSYITS